MPVGEVQVAQGRTPTPVAAVAVTGLPGPRVPVAAGVALAGPDLATKVVLVALVVVGITAHQEAQGRRVWQARR